MFLQSTDKIVGRYSIAKRDADSNVLEQYEFNNLIIPTALAQAAQRRLIEVIELGSGITPPTEQDSTLSAPIGGQWIVAYKDTTAGFDVDSNQPTLSYNYYALIPEGIAISNIREFGMFDSNTGLFSRALLKAGEEQLTLTKGENEYIEIYYSVIIKLPMGEQSVKTFNYNAQDITVTSEAFANATDIGRFDGVRLIDGIYVNSSAVPALGHVFQPGLGTILPVNLNEQQLRGREDVTYTAPLLTEDMSIYEIVVKSQMGWHSYRFSPAIELPISAKWALSFGLQWAHNEGAYVMPPQLLTLQVIDQINLTPTIDIISFDEGALPTAEEISFVGLASEGNTSTALRETENINLVASSVLLGHDTETDVYTVQLHDYYGVAVFKVSATLATWMKPVLQAPETTIDYTVTFNGETELAYTFDRSTSEMLFHVNGDDVFFTPRMGLFNAVHHITLTNGSDVFEVKISKEGFLPNLYPATFNADAMAVTGEGNVQLVINSIAYNPITKVHILNSSAGSIPLALQLQALIPVDPDTYTSRWAKMVDANFKFKLDLDTMGILDLPVSSVLNTLTSGDVALTHMLINGHATYTLIAPTDDRDVFTSIIFGIPQQAGTRAYLTKPNSEEKITLVQPLDSFDIVLSSSVAEIGTIVTVATSMDITLYSLSPLLPFEVSLSSETIRIRLTRG